MKICNILPQFFGFLAVVAFLPASASGDGWYVGGLYGYSDPGSAEGSVRTEDPLGQATLDRFDMDYSGSALLGLVGGYETGGMRLDLELRDFSHEIGEPAASSLNASELDATTAFVNLWGELGSYWGGLRPYIGGGLGVASLSAGSGSGTEEAFQIGLGASYWMSQHWVVTAGARYLDVGALKYHDDSADSDNSIGFSGAQLSVGIRYNFFGCGDSDSDGVCDEVDSCTASPANFSVDDAGCVVDSDADGVRDDRDQCASTPGNVQVDSSGCALDSDKDGVHDAKDQCPNTPARVKVDAQGCRVDSDRDGVFDENDRCQGTPGQGDRLGMSVDASGCLAGEGVVLDNVNFGSGTALLTNGARAILGQVAEVLNRTRGFKVELQGHTDSQGAAEDNLKLSQARAEAVKAYLVSLGVSEDRLVSRGYGESQPVASNETKEGRSQNRRVVAIPFSNAKP